MHARPTRRHRAPVAAVMAALAFMMALPASTLGYNTASPAYVAFTNAVPNGARIVPLVNSGDTAFGTIFEGIPDGIGVVPVDDDHVDLYVAHEQSHVPFPIGVVDPVTGITQTGTADFQDSSVTRVRVQISTRAIVDMDVALSPDEGFIRFCSAFMAGPEHGFDDYTFLVNEESDDNLPVPDGAVYDADPSMAGLREGGYSAYLNTSDWSQLDVIPGLGRHNHENTVVVPGGWDELAALSGDDTFNAPSSQLYLYTAADADAFLADQGGLWAFRVTDSNGAAPGGVVDAANPQNHANDYLDISAGETFGGQFIPVPPDVARGDLATEHPQAGLENWSNANNVFQFVRIEDIAYDPDDPRVVYFTDTGTTRLRENASGRLFRASANDRPYTDSDGRVFKMVLNADDPTIVDSLSIIAEGRLREQLPPNATPTINVLNPGVGFVNPDNLAVGHKSIMVQEDSASNNRVWQYKFNKGTWTHVASATQAATAETSGIVSLADTFGDGWWALDVQSHVNKTTDAGPYFWPDGPDPNTDPDPYRKRREDGQLLLMFIPAS